MLFTGNLALQGGNGVPFGDGLRLVGGALQRLGIESADAGGQARWGPGLAAIFGWSAGETRYFQVWYRDPVGGPCGTGFNLSNGLSAQLSN